MLNRENEQLRLKCLPSDGPIIVFRPGKDHLEIRTVFNVLRVKCRGLFTCVRIYQYVLAFCIYKRRRYCLSPGHKMKKSSDRIVSALNDGSSGGYSL